MTAAFEELIHLLEKRDVHFSTTGDRSLRTDLRGAAAIYQVVARVDPATDLFQVFAYSPLIVPEGSRAAIAEGVARANYGLRIGKFEFDMDDGELRFQAAQILTSDSLGEEVIDRMIRTTLGMLDIYLPAFLSIIYGNEVPRHAIRCAEAGNGEPDEADDETPPAAE